MERSARTIVPFVVSALLLAYVFDRIDIRMALDFLTLDVVLRFCLPLVLFGVVTLAIEAQCLHRVVAENAAYASPLNRATAARIKAASYLLGVLNYALGAAGLSVLLRRRNQASIAVAAGMVVLISLFDIGSVLVWVVAGGTLLQTETAGLRLGLFGGLIGAIVAGFVFLRTEISMGPLEVVRELPILRAPRSAPIRLLVEIGLLRLLFVGCFVALVRALFWAFGIPVDVTTLAFNVGIMLVVSALPVAAGGLGTGQIVFVELFSGIAPDTQLLAMSVVFSFAMIFSRAAVGLLFAPEFTREALAAAREERGAEEAKNADG
jgi:uncharacterized membrane protein YbhN (UPF0104 family)